VPFTVQDSSQHLPGQAVGVERRRDQHVRVEDDVHRPSRTASISRRTPTCRSGKYPSPSRTGSQSLPGLRSQPSLQGRFERGTDPASGMPSGPPPSAVDVPLPATPLRSGLRDRRSCEAHPRHAGAIDGE
jgi:hypothetical protein